MTAAPPAYGYLVSWVYMHGDTRACGHMEVGRPRPWAWGDTGLVARYVARAENLPVVTITSVFPLVVP